MAFRAPVLGYNTNVRHKGKLYHIQTEDSGIDHPHVITHLFADGGRIVASKKTSYAERVGSDGLQEQVKKLMQAQHKQMFIALRDGVYDEDGPNDSANEQTGTHPIPPGVAAAPALAPVAKPDDVTTPVELLPKSAEPVPQYKGTKAAAGDKPLTVKPPKPARSLFGGDLLNEKKSLDEVILNYLAANDKES
jgi:hypothetical protein